MASEAGATIIGRSAVLRGEITGEGDVQIDGSLEGNLRVPTARVVVGADATVRAIVQAQDVIVHGRVEGDLQATGRVDLRSTAVVVGDIYAARFSMEQEAVLRGNVDNYDAARAGAHSDGGGKRLEPHLPAGSGDAAERRTAGSAPSLRSSGAIPSGLAAAAATVSSAGRPGVGSERAESLPQPAWAAEPKSS